MLLGIKLLALAACSLVIAGAAGAAEFEVKMLSQGVKGAMVFEPDLLRIAPGDTVHFVPTQPDHDVSSIRGMLPEGAEPFKGELDTVLTVTFTVEGVYGYKCNPHYVRSDRRRRAGQPRSGQGG
jgi:plastocyanin